MADPNTDNSKVAFENCVKAILTTFGVFTGFVIKAAIDGVTFPPSDSWWDTWDRLKELLVDPHLYVCLATIALLLRFIIGSSVHLNLCYVIEPRSRNPRMLVKDLAFLIVFGLLAIFMVKAGNNVPSFASRAGVFISVGLVWSALDAWLRSGEAVGEQSLFSKPWIIIDLFQLGLVVAVIFLAPATAVGELVQAGLLAIGFGVALYWDMKVVLQAKPLPPDPASRATTA